MELQFLKLAYFSPTGTTRSIIQAVARGINPVNAEHIDVTKPDMRKKPLRTSKSDLLVVGVPVYIGRVPELLIEWLQGIKADKTPTVCIVVYGNRAYDDALLELKNFLIERGCVPVACAAFIGEHSFSSPEIPIAEARPDSTDIEYAELFGRKINEKLLSVSSVDQIPDINLPGNNPYRGDAKLWKLDFIEVSGDCLQCGICAEVCPVGAVDTGNSNSIDKDKCITCCACIKNCPQNARTVKDSPLKDAAIRLNKMHCERKEPVSFFK